MAPILAYLDTLDLTFGGGGDEVASEPSLQAALFYWGVMMPMKSRIAAIAPLAQWGNQSDCLTSYRWLLKQGVAASQVGLVGE